MSPRLMDAWQHLNPFADVRAALEKLKKRYRLVALSNGEADFFGPSGDQPHWLGL